MKFTTYSLSYKRNERFRFIQWLLLVLITSFILILEFYYQYGHCAVSQQYSNKNLKLTHEVLNMLDDLSISYWPDCQSLLNVLRNETFNVWDHDVDLSIEWPLSSKLNNIDILIKEIEKYGFHVDFHSERKLLTLQFQDDMSKYKSHVDIWLWERKYIYNDEKKIVLENLDFTITYKNRLTSDIYPLKFSTWLGRNITIPFDSHTIAYKEYGKSYMEAIVFRKSCIHNLFLGRWI